jgi:hypothetical protein
MRKIKRLSLAVSEKKTASHRRAPVYHNLTVCARSIEPLQLCTAADSYHCKGNLMAAKAKTNNTAANLGFEAKLWLAADKL